MFMSGERQIIKTLRGVLVVESTSAHSPVLVPCAVLGRPKLLLDLSAQGYCASALILPLYYLADASITLIRRGLRGATVWQAHREHFYQSAVDRGARHGAVVGAVICANLGLIVLAVLAALKWPWPALAGAAAVVSALLFHLGPGMKGPAARWRAAPPGVGV